MQEKLIKRKTMRHKKASYNDPGAYFITICTKNKECILSSIAFDDSSKRPYVELSACGIVAEKYIRKMSGFYDNISVEHFVIMPNHIHLLLLIRNTDAGSTHYDREDDHTNIEQNTTISRFVSTFKRFCNSEFGENVWQYRSYDHIIRNKYDYDGIVRYIYENPQNWYYDELFVE